MPLYDGEKYQGSHRIGADAASVKYMPKVCLPLLCLLLTLRPVGAQDGQRFSAQANLVRVPTLVRDSKGAAVLGLHVEDFIIENDGVAQPAHLDEAAEAEPVSLMIAVQCGRRAKREYGRMEGLSSILDPVLSNPDNEAAVLFFDSKLNLAADFSPDGDQVEKTLQKLPSGDDGAAILDAVAYSARLLGRRGDGRKKVLLLISETRDHGSIFTKLDDALAVISSNNVSVFSLPFSPYVSQQLDDLRGTNKDEWGPGIDLLARLKELRQAMRKNVPATLASITGGECVQFSSKSGFEDHLIDFANHLHSRYELSFEPKHPHPGLHGISVRLASPKKGSTLLYRTTYWVGSDEETGEPSSRQRRR